MPVTVIVCVPGLVLSIWLCLVVVPPKSVVSSTFLSAER